MEKYKFWNELYHKPITNKNDYEIKTQVQSVYFVLWIDCMDLSAYSTLDVHVWSCGYTQNIGSVEDECQEARSSSAHCGFCE